MVPAASTTDRRLIINADDYGISPGVNAGILEAVRAGIVTSISVMVNTPAFADGMRALAALPHPPSVGLHVNLTAGFPVTPAAGIPSLVRSSGALYPLSALVIRACAARVHPRHIEREVRAQLTCLRQAWPDVRHVDSHQHVHALPGVWEAVRRAADGIRMREPCEPAGRTAGRLKRLAIATSWRIATRRGASASTHVRGIGMHGSRHYLEDLLSTLDRLPAGVTELIVHPGRRDPSIAPFDPYDAPREAELAALLSDPLRRRVHRGDLVLGGFEPADAGAA